MLSTAQTLILHWNGTAWSVVSSPNNSTGNNFLTDVATASPTDILATGTGTIKSLRQALVEEDSGSGWTVVPLNVPATATQSTLYGVSSSSVGDVWAVGEMTGGTASQTSALILHRTAGSGGSFQQVPADTSIVGTNRLYRVDAISANDVWAVGTTSSGGPLQTLAEHWDGVSWKRVPTPNPTTTTDAMLTGVSATSSTDVWAVGDYTATDGTIRPLAEHWNGTTWSIVSTPTTSSQQARLFTIAALSPTDAYTVGSYFNGANNRPLIMHWDGSSWSEMGAPGLSGFRETSLFGVAASSASDIWAVGGAVGHTLTDHLCP